MKHEPVIAVDFGGTSIKIGVTQGAEILDKAEPLPTEQYGSPAEIMDAMCNTMSLLKRKHPAVKAIGLGMPGWVDFRRGVLYQLTNVPVWNKQEPVREVMQRNLGLPVVLDNDANCMAYAEWKLGAGQNFSNLVCITLGTGIGGGIIIDGKMLRGRCISSGEIGQTSICYHGPAGPFGNRGAIESYLRNREVAAEASQRYADAGISRSPAACTLKNLDAAARSGDPIAQGVYDDFAEKLSTLIMNLMYTLVPDAFIIGGGISQAGDLLFIPLRQQLKEQLFPIHDQSLRLLPAHFSSDSGLIGAGLMASDYAKGCLE